MRNIRQLCAATLLMFVLATFAFAGQMSTPVADPPPPPSSPTSVMTDGHMDTIDAGQIGTGSSEAVNPITAIALNVLQSVMSLF